MIMPERQARTAKFGGHVDHQDIRHRKDRPRIEDAVTRDGSAQRDHVRSSSSAQRRNDNTYPCHGTRNGCIPPISPVARPPDRASVITPERSQTLHRQTPARRDFLLPLSAYKRKT